MDRRRPGEVRDAIIAFLREKRGGATVGEIRAAVDQRCPEALEEWQAGAKETAGSWWPHWIEWLKARSGAQVPARDPAKGPLKPLGDAPGEYVKVRS